MFDVDGITITIHLEASQTLEKHGCSNAAKFQKARRMTQNVQRQQSRHSHESVVAGDIETTGLDPSKDAIISIAAVKSIPMVKQVSLTD